MPPKQKTPAPIDRPLSRAYLRGFTGWSTAYPPGHSEPTSLRIMENMYVDRNGSLLVRHGLRYVSYAQSPDTDPLTDAVEGIAIDRPLVGTQEPFYVSRGETAEKALLFAVREADDTVGFRALLFTGTATVVRRLTDPEIGFEIAQGEAALNFSAKTTHVEYLQIDNKILAMSDVGEPARLFFVGAELVAKVASSITQPLWEVSHKLKVVHPDAAWVNKQTTTTRRNEIFNPSFEVGAEYWTPSALTGVTSEVAGSVSGTRRLRLHSLPTRTNMQTSPLHAVATSGIGGWYPHADYGNPKLSKDGAYLKIYDSKGSGTFLAYGAKLSYGVQAGKKYRVAMDIAIGTNVEPIAVLTFYNAAGAKIGNSTTLVMPRKTVRFSSGAVTAPTGTVTMRLSVGGRNEKSTSTFVKVKNIVLCKDGEPTTMFSGATTDTAGHDYSWAGTANASASIDHPPVNISITSSRVPVRGGSPFWSSISATSTVAVRAFSLITRSYNKDSVLVATSPAGAGSTVLGTWTRASAGMASSVLEAVKAEMVMTFTAIPRGQYVYVDAAMLESGAATAGTYFDGSTAPTTLISNQWGNTAAPHKTFSVQTIKADLPTLPAAETPTVKTLVASGGAAANTYKIGFFYTFSNEMGESAASRITEIRVSRPWANWIWETPNTAGEPSGTATENDLLTADQLVISMDRTVYDQAIAEGAIKWNLYAFAWSDQEPVPVVAQVVGEKNLYPDEASTLRAVSVVYEEGGWIAVTPARRLSLNEAILPTRTNRTNFSAPPRARTGLVAGDRLIVLGDPEAGLATIRWTSNRPGEYTNFTAARGGGEKTLTSGNLNIPAAVVLWQNPQSVDTLTVLCMNQDGSSVSYYMQPATVNAQSGTTQVMGFEETTSTPGTMSPYGNEVLNNALFRPTDRSLLKSTAQNYNISHKQLTDLIANMWVSLRNKEWIMSAQINNRLCYLVHNPYGELLAPGCKGNEIWVYDINSETGFWSRFLIQGAALRVFSMNGREYLGITRPEGLYYLDADARLDDWVVTDPLDPDYLKVKQRPIPWRFETNTQGANRAHDAWAHLQQVQITLGNFRGTMRYGIRGQDVNHRKIEATKVVSDLGALPEDEARWDIDDILQVRRDMKEWFFYASSIEGMESWGEVGYVQYRYTPVSVNVGYEYGSVETFEYGSNVESGPNGHSDNGIPIPVMDYTRP